MLTVEADACIVLFNAAAKQLCGRPCKMALGPGDGPAGALHPLAEECGLIDALDDWVLNETCRQLAGWRGEGLSIRSIAVNLSPTDLTLPQTIAMPVRAWLMPRDLTVEITEGVLVDLNRGIPQGLDEIYTFGMRLMTDDFGTGYFNLSYLRRRSAG